MWAQRSGETVGVGRGGASHTEGKFELHVGVIFQLSLNVDVIPAEMLCLMAKGMGRKRVIMWTNRGWDEVG